MSFRKVAGAQSLGRLTFDAEAGFAKVAQREDPQTSYYLDGSAKIDVRGILARTAEQYAISSEPSDYVFEVIRANTTSVFNDNHDGFAREELLRFDPRLKTAVYLTYREKPHHVNHRTENAKRARGVVLDAHYNAESTPLESCPSCNTRTAERGNRDKSGIFCKKCGTVVNDEFVEILVGIDTKKDPAFARAVQRGQLRFGSMGCTCSETICNVCNNVARTRSDFCTHIASHKGSLWARKAGADEWQKINPRSAEAEMARRGRKLHLRDFVRLVADDGYEIRKAAEWCQGVEYDEYSRVHMPADPRAERIELLSRSASVDGIPTSQDLQNETAHLVAAARAKGSRRTAAQEKTAMKYTLVRVNGDPDQTFAAETVDAAMQLANTGPGDQVEVATVEADDAGSARLMADAAEFKPLHDQHGMHQLEGDVEINITDSPQGETVETLEDDDVPPPDEPPPDETIEQFTTDVLGPEEAPPGGDEEMTPGELGIMPAGASKEATMFTDSSFADWKVQVTPRGTAQIVAPNGPVMLVKSKRALRTDSAKIKFGQELLQNLTDHGLFKTAEKYEGVYHSKFASVVDYAIDDMEHFPDKDTKDSIAGGGVSDMGDGHDGESRGMHADDVRDDDIADMQPGGREVEVDMTPEGRISDNELQNTDARPDSATENQDSDMRTKRPPFSVAKDDAISNPVFDHAERVAMVGKWVAHKSTRKHARIAAYDKAAQQFVLVDSMLTPTEVKAGDLVKQWMQLARAPESIDERYKRWAKAEIAKARKQATTDVFRAVKLAAARAAKGMESSPLKEAVATQLANDKVVGHDGVSQAPLEYRGMSDELAIHLTEAAFHAAAEREINTVLNRAASLLKHDSEYLGSAEADVKKLAYRVPPVTTASMVNDLDREAEALRQQVTAGNLELSSTPPEASTRVATVNGAANKIRNALGGTRAAARIQLRP